MNFVRSPLSIESAVALHKLVATKDGLVTFKLLESDLPETEDLDFAGYVLAKCLGQTTSLRNVTLSSSKFSMPGYEVLERVLSLQHGNHVMGLSGRRVEPSSIAIELTKSLKTNNNLVTLDFGSSEVPNSALREIAFSLSKTCNFERFCIGNIDRPVNSKIVEANKIIMKLVARCPSLTFTEIYNFNEEEERDPQESPLDFQSRQERLRREYNETKNSIEAFLEFNETDRAEIAAANANANKRRILQVLKKYNHSQGCTGDQGCLFEALKLSSPLLFQL